MIKEVGVTLTNNTQWLPPTWQLSGTGGSFDARAGNGWSVDKKLNADGSWAQWGPGIFVLLVDVPDEYASGPLLMSVKWKGDATLTGLWNYLYEGSFMIKADRA